jgi:branched-chain amino acid transport system ATP-binding protein
VILEVAGVNTYYGTSHILFDVTLGVKRGMVVALLGRNGAGKTTTMRSIMGLTHPRSGLVKFEGMEMKGSPPHDRAKKGMGFVPDDRRVFPTLTVRENLQLGKKRGPKEQEPWTIDRVYEFFPMLRKLDARPGGNLSGGEQQMLTIARTLMGNPTLLLMDEPAEGLSPLVVRELIGLVMNLKRLGQTILVSEQNLPFALAVSDEGYVIEKGAIRYHGSIEDLQANEEVRTKYLMV